MSDDKPNSMKGRDSFDIEAGNLPAIFINRNVTPYPTEVGAPKFDIIQVEKERDQHYNQAVEFVNQEVDRLREQAEVIQRQYERVQRRLLLTQQVHESHYIFVPQAGKIYHLYHEKTQFNDRIVLVRTGPDQWSSGIPISLTFIASLRKLADNTWEEV